jgi:hypothetical protein
MVRADGAHYLELFFCAEDCDAAGDAFRGGGMNQPLLAIVQAQKKISKV